MYFACALSRIVSQCLNCDFETCVLPWGRRFLNAWFKTSVWWSWGDPLLLMECWNPRTSSPVPQCLDHERCKVVFELPDDDNDNDVHLISPACCYWLNAQCTWDFFLLNLFVQFLYIQWLYICKVHNWYICNIDVSVLKILFKEHSKKKTYPHQHAYTRDPTKLEWAYCAAVQA